MAAGYCLANFYDFSQQYRPHGETQENEQNENETGETSENREPVGKFILNTRQKIYLFCQRNRRFFRATFIAAITLVYIAYFTYAMYLYDGEGSRRLLILTVVVTVSLTMSKFYRWNDKKIKSWKKPIARKLHGKEERISWIVVGLIWLIVIIVIIYDVASVTKDAYNLVSFSGIFVIIFISFLLSKNKARVTLRPVVWGIGLQFVFALLILRMPAGRTAFTWLGQKVDELLSHVQVGTKFMFGSEFDATIADRIPNGLHHYMGLEILPVIVLTSCFVSLLYYIGAMQWLIVKCAVIMRVTMGTSAAESLAAAGNIFLGMTEAPLMIRPLLKDMSVSELHSLMCGGFATIAGNVLAAYIAFGAPSTHLLSASVMSAPAALAISKLMYPEKRKRRITENERYQMEESPASNISHAVYIGAASSIALLASILVNVIAVVAILHFVNDSLAWLGARIGLLPPDNQLSLQFICSYILWPLALVMGVEIFDCRQVAGLIGVKVFLNEFIAFNQLGVLIDNKKTFDMFNGTWIKLGENVILQNGTNSITLQGGVLFSDRSVAISTYALCGFANFGSIGILLGSLSAMIPQRRKELVTIALSSMIGGNLACFLTASIAGIFYKPG